MGNTPESCVHVSQYRYDLNERIRTMDPRLQRYLNGFVTLLSVLVGAVMTALVLPTTGEAVNTGSVVLWTAAFALLTGGITYRVFLRDRSGTLRTDAPE